MQSSIVVSESRRLAGLCAACARIRIALPVRPRFSITSTPVAPSPFDDPRAVPRCHSLTPILADSIHSPSQLRWFSASARSPVQEQEQEHEHEHEQASQPKTATATTTTASTSTSPSGTTLPYYALFPQTLPRGPPPKGSFHIDTRALRREFFRLQAASHPDLHYAAALSETNPPDNDKGQDNDRDKENDASPSPESPSCPDPELSHHPVSRRQAEAISARINAAYRTLSSPLLRAQYILAERFGIDLAGDEAGSLTQPDQNLLLEVLYAREIIEAAASEDDLEGLKAENEERMRACEEALGKAFAEEDVEAAKRETVRLRYWVNIRESCDNWEAGKPIVLQH